MSSDMLSRFKEQMYRITRDAVFAPAPGTAPETPAGAPAAAGQPATPGREVSAAEAQAVGEQPEAGDEGRMAYEVAKADPAGASGQPSMPMVAIAGVILLLCLIGVGYFKAEILSLLGFVKNK
ncbi:MAG: hypothetical protein PQ964_06690 [Methanobacteriaceae archaeon]|jgi:cobaltochelatase CobN